MRMKSKIKSPSCTLTTENVHLGMTILIFRCDSIFRWIWESVSEGESWSKSSVRNHCIVRCYRIDRISTRQFTALQICSGHSETAIYNCFFLSEIHSESYRIIPLLVLFVIRFGYSLLKFCCLFHNFHEWDNLSWFDVIQNQLKLFHCGSKKFLFKCW